MRVLLLTLSLAAASGCASPDSAESGATAAAIAAGEACGRCETALGIDDEAYCCDHGCTFCATCTQETGSVCVNCEGSLAPRPDRGKGAVRSR